MEPRSKRISPLRIALLAVVLIPAGAANAMGLADLLPRVDVGALLEPGIALAGGALSDEHCPGDSPAPASAEPESAPAPAPAPANAKAREPAAPTAGRAPRWKSMLPGALR